MMRDGGGRSIAGTADGGIGDGRDERRWWEVDGGHSENRRRTVGWETAGARDSRGGGTAQAGPSERKATRGIRESSFAVARCKPYISGRVSARERSELTILRPRAVYLRIRQSNAIFASE